MGCSLFSVSPKRWPWLLHIGGNRYDHFPTQYYANPKSLLNLTHFSLTSSIFSPLIGSFSLGYKYIPYLKKERSQLLSNFSSSYLRENLWKELYFNFYPFFIPPQPSFHPLKYHRGYRNPPSHHVQLSVFILLYLHLSILELTTLFLKTTFFRFL